MPMLRLDHVNLRTHQLAAMLAWYREVLGLEEGWRPPFSFGGAWLYCAGNPIIHLVEIDRAAAGHDPKLEHFAIAAQGLRPFLDRLTERRVRFELSRTPGTEILQVNVWDPDGNHVHVDFVGEGDAPSLPVED